MPSSTMVHMWGDLVLYGMALILPAALAAAFLACRRYRCTHPGRHAVATLIGGNVLALLFLASLLFLAGESYYRFWYDRTDSFSLTRTSTRWFERHYEFNRAGFRDDVEYTHARPADKRRISFLGDSFTVAHGVENVADRFVNRIRRAHPKWQVEALAVNGFDTGSEIALLNQLLDQGHELDQVVLISCLNDIADIVPERKSVSARIAGYLERPNFLIQHSDLVNTLYFRLVVARDPDVADYYRFVLAAYQSPIWQQQQQRLTTLRDICHGHAAQLLVVQFPFLHQLGSGYEYRRAHEQLQALWRALGVPSLDLLPVYEQHQSEVLVVNDHDAHPNERAHEIAAQAIDDFLVRNLNADVAGPVAQEFGKGVALMKRGQVEAAQAQLERVLELWPDHADAHSVLGAIAMQREQPEQAASHFAAAARLRDDRAEEHSNLALALTKLGRLDEALEHYRRALLLQPDFAEAHLNLALALEAKGERAEADVHYREAVRLKPELSRK